MANRNKITDKLRDKFFSDPDWKEVEDLILGYIEPLLNMKDIDTSQPAEHVKAEIIARTLAHESMSKFVQESGLVSRPIRQITSNFR